MKKESPLFLTIKQQLTENLNKFDNLSKNKEYNTNLKEIESIVLYF